MKILSRYVLREHLGPLAFALTALTSLLMLNFIAKRFGDIVGKGLPASVIAEFFLLALPFTVAMTLPMAVLVAVLYAFSRLASESEITALKASGVSMGRILTPVLGGATVLALGMVYFNDFVLPEANHQLRILQTDIGRTKPTFALREQVINDIIPGRLFLRALRIDKARNRLHDVVIYDFGDGSKRRTIVADSGDLTLTEGTGDLTMLLFHGTMTEIPTAQPTQLTRLAYERDRITVRGVANSFSRDSADNYKSEREMGVCEMQAQVYGAERELYAEQRSAAAVQARAIRALTRGIVDTLRPPDSLRTASPGIGRYYCEATAALTALFRGGDSTTTRGGTPTTAAAPVSPTIGPVVTPADRAVTPVPAGVPDTAAPASGTTVTVPAPTPSGSATVEAPQSLLPPSTVTPSMASSGIGSQLEQTLQRGTIARSTWQQYEVEIHKKFSLAVACIVFVLLGAPIALRFPRGGVGLVIGASLAVFALYYICLIAGESMADDGVVPPWVAMWAANLVFTLVGVVLFLRMGREGSTARGGDLDEVKDRIRNWFASLRPAARRAAAVPAIDR
ncbi:MAG: LptF/LptG family permease [Gemmatimonadaceae bacterium]|nr:LptF/LptG family permease [Gemmatimonadaceae bacterium]